MYSRSQGNPLSFFSCLSLEKASDFKGRLGSAFRGPVRSTGGSEIVEEGASGAPSRLTSKFSCYPCGGGKKRFDRVRGVEGFLFVFAGKL